MTSSAREKAKRYAFKAEVKQLLDILVHSVYTSKDIFIRELISNAVDALEKVRFSKVQGTEVHEPDAPLEIHIESREEEGQKIFVIADTGVGMTADEVRANLGTIARSGAVEFLAKVKEAGQQPDLSLIGRFGIGFYSVFMVAEKVRVTSRSSDPGAEGVVWTSDGAGSFTVGKAEPDVPRGTRIEAYLKKDDENFTEPHTIKSAIRKYSNFVPFPILVDAEKVNQAVALWREPPNQIKDSDYHEFFKYLTYETEEPLLRLHFSADVPLQFSALLFVPKSRHELLGFGEGEVSLQLYVKRVLIDGTNRDLLPKFLRFVQGVVESEDLPLNISRETLQENPFVLKMRDVLTRKLLEKFAKLAAEQPEEYRGFWRSFGRFLKEGYADFAHRDKVADLLRFNSSHHDDEEGLSSLAEYVERCPEAQTAIYYLSGPSRSALKRDPRLELFAKKGIEVLYLNEAADEFVLSGIGKYREKPLVSADQVKPDDLKDLGVTETEDRSAEDPTDLEPLLERFRKVLGDRVQGVRASERLVDSPACMVNEEGMTGHMQKVLRLMGQEKDLPKRTLELNPSHILITNLLHLVRVAPTDPFIDRACEQIFESSMLADGYLTDPHQLVERVHETLADAAALKRDQLGE